MNRPQLSIVIPVLNEARIVAEQIAYIRSTLAGRLTVEIILVDGGSEDGTQEIAVGLADRFLSTTAGRARQLNAGAAIARGEYFYFLHVDSRPPERLAEWLHFLQSDKIESAGFRMRFASKSLLLRGLSWCTRINLTAFRYGDQSLLVRAETFKRLGGYDESYILMEGNDLVRRLKGQADFRLLDDEVISSPRKYDQHGAFYLQTVYVLVYLLQRLGLTQRKLAGIYRRLLG